MPSQTQKKENQEQAGRSQVQHKDPKSDNQDDEQEKTNIDGHKIFVGGLTGTTTKSKKTLPDFG